ncbi:MAG: DUF1462 family protein [Sporolactobacillus sp.]
MILTLYGAESICASCVQAPSSKSTAEWLQAALSRKFGQAADIRYIDLEHPETEQDRLFCKRIKADEFFYPLLVSGDAVIGEGYIVLKTVVKYLKEQGLEDSRHISPAE